MDKKDEHRINVWLNFTNEELKEVDNYREQQTLEKWESLNTRPSHRRGIIPRKKILQEIFRRGLKTLDKTIVLYSKEQPTTDEKMYQVTLWFTEKELKEVETYRELLTQEKWESAKYPSLKRGKVSRNKTLKDLIFFALDFFKKDKK